MSTPARDTDGLRTIIKKRLNDIRQRHFGSDTEMAEVVGVSQSSMSRLLRGELQGIDPYLKAATALAEELEMNLDHLTTPQGLNNGQAGHRLKVYEDVEAGAGDGVRPVSEWKSYTIRIPNTVMQSMIGARSTPDEVGIIRVRGESMYPEVQSGDWVMFTPVDDIADGATCIIRLDDALVLKVIQRKAGQRLRIHSLNSAFEDDYIRRTESGQWVTDDENQRLVEFQVIGEFLTAIQPKDLYAAGQRVRDAVAAYQEIASDV